MPIPPPPPPQEPVNIPPPPPPQPAKAMAAGTTPVNLPHINPVWLIASLVLVVVVLGGGFFWVQRHRIPEDLLQALKTGDSAKVIGMVDQTPELLIRTDPNGMTPLDYAAEQNLTSAAQEMLVRGAKVDAQDQQGRTALHYAAITNHPDMVSLLLAHEAPEGARDKDFKTAYELAKSTGQSDAQLAFESWDLERAIDSDDHAAIDKLISSQLSELYDGQGWTVLHYAASKGNQYAVARILDNGARIDATTLRDLGDADGTPAHSTALHIAARSGNVGLVNMLLARGADASVQDGEGRIPLILAAREGSVEAVKALADRYFEFSAWQQARDAAAENNHVLVVDQFDNWWRGKLFSVLEHTGPDQMNLVAQYLSWPVTHPALVTRSSDGCTPLAVAVSSGNPNINLIKLLISAEPKAIATADTAGETPLILAARNDSPEIISTLIDDAGADSAITGSHGQELLKVAVNGNNSAAVQLLVSHYHFDVNGNISGNRPLQIACDSLNPQMVKLLLTLGAQAQLADIDATVAAAASSQATGARNSIVDELAQRLILDQLHSSHPDSTIIVDVIEKSSGLGIHLLSQPLLGQDTLLQVAIRQGNPIAIKPLIEAARKRALINWRNPFGNTALHTAAFFGQTEAVQDLLAAGADYHIRNSHNQTAEAMAESQNQNGAAKLLADARIADEQKASNERQQQQKIIEQQRQAQLQAKQQQLAAQQAERDAQGAKQRADADAVNEWFNDMANNKTPVTIDAVGILQRRTSLIGTSFWVLEGHPIYQVLYSPDGVLTIISFDPIVNMGTGRLITVNRQKIEYRSVTHYDRHGIAHVVQQPVTVTVQTFAHGYSGLLTPQGEGHFAWHVGDQVFMLSTAPNQ